MTFLVVIIVVMYVGNSVYHVVRPLATKGPKQESIRTPKERLP